jgi:uncharacterized membrane protein YeaQ/YmgE (transglycosylase-associated protein family)
VKRAPRLFWAQVHSSGECGPQDRLARLAGPFAETFVFRAFTGETPMTLTGFLLLLLIAAICGSLAQAIVGYSHGGCLVSAALGLIGALIGNWLARVFGLPYGFEVTIDGQEFPVIWSILGATLFVAVLNLLTYRRPTAF